MSDVNGQRSNGLPKGWEWVKLKEVCSKIIGGGTPSTKEPRFWDGDIPWISSADIEGLKEIFPRKKITKEALEKSTTNILPKGGIIVVTRVGLGKIAIAPFDICFSQDSQGLILNEKRITQSYALIYLSKAVQKFKHESRGTTINGVTKKQLIELNIPLPPLSEQERIASKLEELFSELDKSIEELKTAQQQLKVYRQSVLKWAFEGRLTNKVHEGELPKEWQCLNLGDIITSVEYGTSAKSKDSGKVPVLRMGNIQKGRFDWTDLVYTDNEEEIQKYSLKKNDVLFNRTNSPELVGKTAIYKGERPAIFAGYLIRINRIEDLINADYLNYFLNSEAAKNYGNSVKTDGVNQSNINGQKLKSYPIPLAPITEQKRIVDEIESRLSVADKVEETILGSLGQAEVLRQTILKKAFEGQLV